MKHRVTNFGAAPLVVALFPDQTQTVSIPPGQSWVGEISSVRHGEGRIQYSVRPAERQAGYAAFALTDDGEDC